MAKRAAKEALVSGARETILESIRKGRGAAQLAPAYPLGPLTNDATARFVARAQAAAAEVHPIAYPDDAPEAILAILSNANLPLRVHLARHSPLNALAWQRAPKLSLSDEPPSGADAAFSAADYAIAETGTLVFLSGPNSFSSWHYRPGREIVLLSKALILSRLEDVIARISPIPATINLVTGPSRTADIEQTIELGAHGPRSLHILLAA